MRVRQVDGVTCGSACLLMLAATGDPDLRRWLETGEPSGTPLREVPAGAAALASVGERIAAAQRHIHRRTSARALGPFPWPGGLGTPPWTAAREARFPGVRYVTRAVDDRDGNGRDMTALIANALAAGAPVLLYTGGTLDQGLGKTAPRHVVLAVPHPATRVTADGHEIISLYDPGSGIVHEVALPELRDRRGPHPALGGWSHVQWLVLPVPAAPHQETKG